MNKDLDLDEAKSILNQCRDCNNLEVLYQITKIVAETDSIGENSKGFYCGDNYNHDDFQRHIKKIDECEKIDEYYFWGNYVYHAGLKIYNISFSRKAT